MNYILFDDHSWKDLLPFTYTRPVSEIRLGILTIREKWEFFLKQKIVYKTVDYLSEKFPFETGRQKNNVWINSKICPDRKLINAINKLKANQVLVSKKDIVAANTGSVARFAFDRLTKNFERINYQENLLNIQYVWDIFSKNGQAFERDFDLITRGRLSQKVSKTNSILGKGKVFIEKGASVEHAILNTTNGDIYIGMNAVIMEGSKIRGPFAACEGAEVKMDTKIYGPTTIGPYSKVGGEINNSVIFGYSNKAHDGFLGNSVIGEWCNLGADTNNSNLKNNYGNVKVWSYSKEEMVDTGLTFCGLFMGDHGKCAINTMFNTGTVVGVNANIFGSDFPIHFIPSFSWGGAEEFEDYKFEKALEVAERVMQRRNILLSSVDKKIMEQVFEYSKKFRVKEEF